MAIEKLVNTGRSQNVLDVLRLAYNNISIITDNYLVYDCDPYLDREAGQYCDKAVLQIDDKGNVVRTYYSYYSTDIEDINIVKFYDKELKRHIGIVSGTNGETYKVECTFISESYIKECNCVIMIGTDVEIMTHYIVAINNTTRDIILALEAKESPIKAYASVAVMQILTKDKIIYGITRSGDALVQRGHMWERLDGKPLYPDDDDY